MDKNNDLEVTIPLDNLEDLKTKYAFDNSNDPIDLEIIKNSSEENDIKSITDESAIEFDNEIKDLSESLIPEEDKENKKKKTLKGKWNELSKNKKIITIVIMILTLILISVATFFFVTQKDDENKPENNIPEHVVIKDNYKYVDGKLIFLDINDREIGTYECKNKDENLCYVAYESNEDNFDVTKYMHEDGSEYQRRSLIYYNKYVFINDVAAGATEIIQLYNIESQSIEETYRLIKSHELDAKNYLIVKGNEGSYALFEILETGVKEVIDYKYDYLGVISETVELRSKIVAKEGNRYYLIDYNGKKLTKVIPEEIKSFNDSYISTATNGAYTIYDYNANPVNDKSYNYVTLLEDYVAYVTGKKIYLIDYDNNKMLEEGIPLTTLDYNPVNVIKEDGSRAEYRYSYILEHSNDVISVSIANGSGDTDYITISLAEGIVSAKQNYFSYFNGKLYFYSDANKTRIIGSYTCTNENKPTMTDTTFSSCYIASDDNSFIDNDMETDNYSSRTIIPIYNNRFVFITDQPSLSSNSTTSVILLDMEEDKKIEYSSVLTYDGSQNGEVTLKNVTNQYIIGKNKSGQFGVIRITSSGVESCLRFENQHIERLGGNLLVKKNNQWILYDYNANEISALFENKIRSHSLNYVATKENGKYYLYDKVTGEKVTKDVGVEHNGVDFIGLYTQLIATVSNASELSIADYNGNLLSSSDGSTKFPLNSTNYYNKGTNTEVAFKFNGRTLMVLGADGKTYTTYGLS